MFYNEGVSAGRGVKGNFVIESVEGLVFPFVPVQSHWTEDEVVIEEVLAAVLSFTFLSILISR